MPRPRRYSPARAGTFSVSIETRRNSFASLMALSGEHALAILKRIGNDNAKGEYYLTDAVAIARDMGLKAVAVEKPVAVILFVT